MSIPTWQSTATTRSGSLKPRMSPSRCFRSKTQGTSGAARASVVREPSELLSSLSG